MARSSVEQNREKGGRAARQADAWSRDELVFLPLGGAGEIGMNLNLYGLAGKWLMVDLGITFADETMPGIDIVMPDPAFIAERRRDLVGIVLTHAHEDHLGAVAYLWPQLECPVYATPFAAAVLRRKLEEQGLSGLVPLHVVPLGGKLQLGPFGIEFISITHSIPEPNALAIHTALGSVVHTGDWKIDPTPLLGEVTDEAALRALGEAGVLALVCDSTNVFNPGESGSEAAVRESLDALVAGRPGRVAVTTFASNVARIKTVAAVAERHGRHLVVVGRSLHRMIEAARETGYMDDLGPLLDEAEGGYLPPDRVLYLCTGCQGEPRGAMARIAGGGHPEVTLGVGDTTIFSAKVIPGNERAIGRMQDQLTALGVEVIGEQSHFVHVSGHPCRDELMRMYEWTRPAIAVPVHGEHRHLVAHAALAAELQVPAQVVIANGQVLKLAPGAPEIVAEVQAGRWYLDGEVLLDAGAETLRERRRMMYNGTAVLTLVLDARGEPLAEPALVLQGIPGADGRVEREARAAVAKALAQLPRAARRHDERMAEAAAAAARQVLRRASGKRPTVEARVIRVED
jgi:ribonuclease J